MSRKNGSKNSLANGVDWTRRVCTTLIVTTDGPTRSAACTSAVRREDPGSRRACVSPAAATAVGASSPGASRVRAAAPRRSAPRRRNPNTAPQSQALLDFFRPQNPARLGSEDDIQTLLGEPSQSGIAYPHEVQTVRGRRRRRGPSIARQKRRADDLRAPTFLGRAKNGRDEAAHHSVQEAIRHDVESGHEPAPRPPRVRHIAGGFLLVAPLLRERGEIMRAEKGP